MNVHELLPKDKHDVDAVAALAALSDDEIAPALPVLLTWLQDVNWPVAAAVIPVVRKRFAIVEAAILDVLKGTDEKWKYNLLSFLLNDLPTRPSDALLQEIERIALRPTPDEREAETDQAAAEIIDALKLL